MTNSYTYIPASQCRKKHCIVYLHGGGFLFGSRQDLPQPYIDCFLDAGYDFLSIDYPLAPQNSFDTLLDTTKRLVTGLLQTLVIENYSFFGRSAGVLLACQLQERLVHKPLCLICFYGAADFTNASFGQKSPHYQQMSLISQDKAAALLSASATPEERFLGYVYARQSGNWLKLMQVTTTYQLRSSLPASFIVHSTNDPDIPFREALRIKRLAVTSQLTTLSVKEHDFDRVVSVDSLNIYQQLLKFLDEQLERF